MVELWLKLITEVAVDWILPMMVVLGSIVAFLVIGSYWSRQGEERLLVQCALAAVALHFLLFVTAYQLPRAIPTPFPSREVRVAVELKGMEEEKPIETLSEHRAPIGETPKVETIEAAPAELAIEPTRPDVAAETAELPEVIQQPQDAILPIENDPLLPDASPITVPENSASIAETAPIRPSEEISRTPAEESVTRVETNGETSAVLPPIDPSRPAPAPIYALNELVTPSISSTEAPDETRNREDQTPIRPSEEMARQSDEQNPSRESTLPEIAEAPDLPMTPAPIPPEIEIPPAEPSTAPIDSVQAPTVRPPTAESKPVIPSESISRERHAEVAVRNEPQPTEAIPVTPEISAASPPFPELPMNEEAMVLAPPLPLEGVKVDAPDVKPPASSSEKRIPTEEMKRETPTAAVPSRTRIATDSAAPPIPGDLPSPPSRGADIEAPSPLVERGSLPNVTESVEPPSAKRKQEPAKQTLLPTSDALKVDRTAESPVRRPSNTSNTMPDSPSLPRSLSMTELPARTGIDTPLEIPTPLPGTNTSATPTPSSTPTIVPKRFNLDVAMAKPESRVERRSPMPSDDSSKLNLKELVPDSTTPPSPVEASINFWDNRLAPNRLAIVYRHGGSDETERAVNSALDWLAAHQSPDGRWDSDGFDAACPRGDKCDGHAIERESDTGLTGLALLAFLGAGHTHLETTKHRENRSPWPELAHPHATTGRRSAKRRSHLLSFDGNACVNGGVCHDERSTASRPRTESDPLARGGAASGNRWLAICSSRNRRYQRLWLGRVVPPIRKAGQA